MNYRPRLIDLSKKIKWKTRLWIWWCNLKTLVLWFIMRIIPGSLKMTRTKRSLSLFLTNSEGRNIWTIKIWSIWNIEWCYKINQFNQLTIQGYTTFKLYPVSELSSCAGNCDIAIGAYGLLALAIAILRLWCLFVLSCFLVPAWCMCVYTCMYKQLRGLVPLFGNNLFSIWGSNVFECAICVLVTISGCKIVICAAVDIGVPFSFKAVAISKWFVWDFGNCISNSLPSS